MADGDRWLDVQVGGRTIEAVILGPPGALPLVYHGGTPSAAVVYRPLAEAALEQGLSFLTTSRPGYARSTPQRGRSVADVAADTAAVLDAVGAGSFLTLGWSGGGPHALACAALLPDRCRAAATLAGVAPFRAGFDWMAGMAPENVDEFGAAVAGEEPLTSFLESAAGVLAGVGGDDIAASLGELASEVDRSALTGAFAEYLAESIRRSLSTGIAGWRDDDLAFVKDWGFPLDVISIPVATWQGDQDRMVPFSHSRWLAGAVAGARAHLCSGEGHLSLWESRIAEVVADLAALPRA
ncbi:MAG TPA: alpha/beta fold hydrolase [Acidimicrobiales bacterium]|nr:alpha/beta fold hydrolase [Acidimicrobiales bacterium]